MLIWILSWDSDALFHVSNNWMKLPALIYLPFILHFFLFWIEYFVVAKYINFELIATRCTMFDTISSTFLRRVDYATFNCLDTVSPCDRTQSGTSKIFFFCSIFYVVEKNILVMVTWSISIRKCVSISCLCSAQLKMLSLMVNKLLKLCIISR